jgi:hypothetical protein
VLTYGTKIKGKSLVKRVCSVGSFPLPMKYLMSVALAHAGKPEKYGA